MQYVSLSYTSVSGIGMIVSLVADLTGAANKLWIATRQLRMTYKNAAKKIFTCIVWVYLPVTILR